MQSLEKCQKVLPGLKDLADSLKTISGESTPDGIKRSFQRALDLVEKRGNELEVLKKKSADLGGRIEDLSLTVEASCLAS